MNGNEPVMSWGNAEHREDVLAMAQVMTARGTLSGERGLP